MRRVRLPGGRPAILSDTVGFISDLPHELVEAFRATLDEVREASIILHVRDIAGPNAAAEAEDVAQVLEALDPGPDWEGRLVEVWNKSDLLDNEMRADLSARAARSGALLVSAATGDGVDGLRTRLGMLVDGGPEVSFRLSASDGEALAWLYRHARVTGLDEHDGQTVVRARLDPQALGQFHRLRPGVTPMAA
jgi:GTP-binding protein HflX